MEKLSRLYLVVQCAKLLEYAETAMEKVKDKIVIYCLFGHLVHEVSFSFNGG